MMSLCCCPIKKKTIFLRMVFNHSLRMCVNTEPDKDGWSNIIDQDRIRVHIQVLLTVSTLEFAVVTGQSLFSGLGTGVSPDRYLSLLPRLQHVGGIL